MGEFAALGTSIFWSFTSMLFTVAGRRVGSVVVNRTRLVIAVLFISTAHILLYGELVPEGTNQIRLFWLGLSGVIGLVLGDAFLFQAFVMLGPRIPMLLMALTPVISTILAWVFLGERLSSLDLMAVLIAVGGVSWVVWESNTQQNGMNRKNYLSGVLYGLGGALGQALGLITSKKGLEGGFPPLSAVLLRMSIAMIVIWIVALFQRQARSTINALKDRMVFRAIVGASICGPFLGVWLSLIAIEQTQIGIASTLMSLAPIFLIPLTRWFFKEQISGRVVFGTITALVGVTMIFLTP